ncbi:NDP-sugar synthase [Streptomyces sp. NPDC050433]|uniref:nucleotidyltransferase family protein n=1 Tax=unclassified Streptomyces TaxID=2593676 RepID=UPI00343EB76D
MSDPVVVIPAGGLGTRLSAVTHDLPKSLAPVLGKPFLYWQLRLLGELGVARTHLCLGYGARDILSALDACSPPGMTVSHTAESAPLGTVGAVRLALPQLPQRFVILYGDVLPLPALHDLWDLHREHRAGATMLVTTAAGENNIGIEADVVTRYDKSGAAGLPFVDIGMTAVEADCLRGLPSQRRTDEEPFFRSLIASGRLRALRWPEPSPHIGDPGHLARCEAWLRAAG